MSDVLKIKGVPLFKTLDRLKSREKTAASEASSNRAEIKGVLEDNPGLHTKALSDFRRLDKMEGHKRLDYFRSFDLLREMAEEERWKEAQADLLDAEPGEPTDESVVPFDGNGEDFIEFNDGEIPIENTDAEEEAA